MLRTASTTSLPAKAAKVMPTVAEDYELMEEIGQGVSAKARAPPRPVGLAQPHGADFSSQVWRAKCKPLDEVVAIKILDLERQDPGKLVRGGGAARRTGRLTRPRAAHRRGFGRRHRP